MSSRAKQLRYEELLTKLGSKQLFDCINANKNHMNDESFFMEVPCTSFKQPSWKSSLVATFYE